MNRNRILFSYYLLFENIHFWSGLFQSILFYLLNIEFLKFIDIAI